MHIMAVILIGWARGKKPLSPNPIESKCLISSEVMLDQNTTIIWNDC